jgi:hypothetical protein
MIIEFFLENLTAAGVRKAKISNADSLKTYQLSGRVFLYLVTLSEVALKIVCPTESSVPRVKKLQSS